MIAFLEGNSKIGIRQAVDQVSYYLNLNLNLNDVD